MSKTWELRTLHHLLREGLSATSDTGPLAAVHCPCGRDTHADLCMDLTALPADMATTIRSALKLAAAAFICDACRSTVFREQHVSQESMYRALGAPESTLAVCREHDEMHKRGMAQ